MSLLTAGRLAVAEMVYYRRPMHHGNLTGGYTQHYLTRVGQLPPDFRPSWRESGYTIWSYDTPIAWAITHQKPGQPATFEWVIPDHTYSRTTTGHQSAVKAAVSDPKTTYTWLKGRYASEQTDRIARRLERHRRVLSASLTVTPSPVRPATMHDEGCPEDGNGYIPGTMQLCLGCALMTSITG